MREDGNLEIGELTKAEQVEDPSRNTLKMFAFMRFPTYSTTEVSNLILTYWVGLSSRITSEKRDPRRLRPGLRKVGDGVMIPSSADA